MQLTADDFSAFFAAVHGDPDAGGYLRPFPWQLRLARRVCAPSAGGGQWPDVLALPTGAGKTTCIDIAVFALACQANVPTSERTAPRRIILVVDRRVVVDEAYEHARKLARKLFEAQSGILKAVADRLRKVGGTDIPLTCHQLRGGIYRDDAWARTPTQPCVIASTVDQIGSRLMFRTYGRPFRAWPVHAGLAGNDALILLDEAHCANAFLQTLRSVARYRGKEWCEHPPGNPFQVVVLSATPPPEAGERMTLEQDDYVDPVLGARISAPKPATLVVATDATGEDRLDKLASRLVEEAVECVSNERRAIAVIANRVATARHAYQLLEAVRSDTGQGSSYDNRTVRKLRSALKAKGIDSFDLVLLIGRMRSVDRDAVNRACLRRLSLSSGDRELERPVFVVATQCIEVGANLDFDAMVTECASLDALRQRFGRLNRSGRPIEARGCVVIRADQASGKQPDPIYGAALTRTWGQLGEWSGESQSVDFGIRQMDQLWFGLSEEERESLLYRAEDAPVLLPAHLDLLVQTSPPPHSTPEVSYFLHGPRRSVPEIQVCWRSDLPGPENWPLPEDKEGLDVFAAKAIQAISLCPPSTAECLPVPLPVFLRWWSTRFERRGGKPAVELADVESMAEPPEVAEPARPVTAIVWRGPRESVVLTDRSFLRPGDTVVLPAKVGGWDVLGHIPGGAEETVDVGQRCHWQARRRAVLRLWLRTTESADGVVVEPFGMIPGARSESVAELERILQEAAADPDLLPESEIVVDLLRDIVREVDGAFLPGWLVEVIEEGLASSCRPELIVHPFGGVVVRARRPAPWPVDVLSRPETFPIEDDTTSAGTYVTLHEHSRVVAACAEKFARLCDLPCELVTTLRLAGWLHDLGKADVRYQAFLHGGNRLVARLAPDVFAKSMGLRDDTQGYRDAWSRAGLPEDFRHEMLSLQIAERADAVVAQLLEACGEKSIRDGGCDTDLLLHLIAMHHGYARPFVPVVDDSRAPVEDLSFWIQWPGTRVDVRGDERRAWCPPHSLGSGVVERFWRLVRRYGWWGLPWLEAMFVLADHRVSEQQATAQETAGGQKTLLAEKAG